MARKFTSKEEVVIYLRNLPINAIIDAAAEAIMAQQTNSLEKIVITPEQLNTFFRVRGTRENGEVETRGRKKKEDVQ